jgi:hypothetical protein
MVETIIKEEDSNQIGWSTQYVRGTRPFSDQKT